MKTFFKIKSVCGGMGQLLDIFCFKNNLETPVNHIYHAEERISFGCWLEKLRHVDQQYRQDGLGLEIAKSINSSHIGICAYMENSCRNVHDYLCLSVRYNKIWYNYTDKEISFFQQDAVISWDKPAYCGAGLYTRETSVSEELQVAVYYQRIMQLTGTSANIFSRVELAIPKPKNIRLYEDYFNCPVVFDAAKTEIIISKDILNFYIKSHDNALLLILKNYADIIVNGMPEKMSFIEAVNQNIIKSLENQDPRIDVVADYLSMPTRALQNSLKEQGVCFQDLLNTARLLLAKQYLIDHQVSILEISSLLGYKEQTSFNRAFKSWTGKSPMHWRKSYSHLYA